MQGLTQFLVLRAPPRQRIGGQSHSRLDEEIGATLLHRLVRGSARFRHEDACPQKRAKHAQERVASRLYRGDEAPCLIVEGFPSICRAFRLSQEPHGLDDPDQVRHALEAVALEEYAGSLKALFGFLWLSQETVRPAEEHAVPCVEERDDGWSPELRVLVDGFGRGAPLAAQCLEERQA